MRELSADVLRDLLRYEPETGLFYWSRPPKAHPRLKEYAAGGISTGYVMIKMFEKKYKAHRLAWLYVYGEWPDGDIDHINGCPIDNRIANLRIATNPENQANRRRNSGKATPKGVRLMPNGRFQARITHKQQQIHLGTYESVIEANAAYIAASKKLYGQYARES